MLKFLMSSILISTCFAAQPILEKQLYITRDPSTNRADFREAMSKIGELIAINIAGDMKTKKMPITTVMDDTAKHSLIDENEVVLVTILRAGLPMLNGMLKVFSNATTGFLAMKRDEKTLKPTVFYQAMPEVEGKIVIIADPMIATGGSMLDAIHIVEALNPKKIIVAGAMSTHVAIEKIKKHSSNIQIYSGVVDPVLTNVGYISPGLGDAGDRSFGVKID